MQTRIETTSNAFTIAVFAATIVLPLLQTLWRVFPEREFAERRLQAPYPKRPYDLNSLLTYPHAFEAYFDDHFGFRNSFVASYLGFRNRLDEQIPRADGLAGRPTEAPVSPKARTAAPKPPELFLFDAERFWKLKPGVELPDDDKSWYPGLVTNSLGFRSPEVSREKSDSTIRVICFGDSCTYANGVRVDDSWPKQLQDRLNRESGAVPFEVINAGVGGYTSLQGLRYMEVLLPQFTPEVVVVTFGGNDLWYMDVESDAETAAKYRERASQQDYRHVAKFRAFVRGLEQGGVPRKDARPARARGIDLMGSFDTAPVPAGLKPRVSLAEYKSNLTAMVDLCAQYDGKPILVLWPSKNLVDDSGPPSRLAGYHDATREVAREFDVPIFDLVLLLRNRKPESLKWFLDVMHLDERGNAFVAEEMSKAIAERTSTIR